MSAPARHFGHAHALMIMIEDDVINMQNKNYHLDGRGCMASISSRIWARVFKTFRLDAFPEDECSVFVIQGKREARKRELDNNYSVFCSKEGTKAQLLDCTAAV